MIRALSIVEYNLMLLAALQKQPSTSTRAIVEIYSIEMILADCQGKN